jgi:hypothetical protein
MTTEATKSDLRLTTAHGFLLTETGGPCRQVSQD